MVYIKNANYDGFLDSYFRNIENIFIGDGFYFEENWLAIEMVEYKILNKKYVYFRLRSSDGAEIIVSEKTLNEMFTRIE